MKLQIPSSPPKSCPLQVNDIVEIIKKSGMAPSQYNRQPWKFSFDVESGSLSCKRNSEVVLSKLDPYRYYELFSIGSAVENLCLAARHDYKVKEDLTWLQTTESPKETVCTLTFKAMTEDEKTSSKLVTPLVRRNEMEGVS